MKNSALLIRLIEYAKGLGNRENAPFSAERFIVAIIDGPGDMHGFNTQELYDCADIIDRTFIGFAKTREMLMRHICSPDNGSSVLFDDLYMKKKKLQVAARAEKEGASEITAVLLLKCILDDPTAAIKAVLLSESESIADKETEEDFRELDKQLDAIKKDIENDAESKEDVKVKGEISTLVSDVKRIRTELKGWVYGQDNAINVFAAGLFRARMLSMLDKTRTRPLATYLFAGPPGVGKTFLAERIAESLKLPFKRFDMSEYADKEANLEFCGSDKVYKNGKAGNVTSFVEENPECVLLFDEIEKAHICVIHLFLQMLDAGRLRDNYTDNEVSFSKAIIILTTNAGKQLYEEYEGGNLSAVPRKIIIKALQKDVNPSTGIPYFPGAICSRFASGNVVMFNHIGANNLREIAKREIERHAASLEKETEIKMHIDERVYTALLLSEGSAADARTIRSRAETFFNDELYELLRLVSSDKVKTGIDDIDSICVNVDFSRTDEAICELFASKDKAKVLVFARPETVELCSNKAPDFEIIGAQQKDAAADVIKNNNIGLVLIDMSSCDGMESCLNLNIEDVDSPARDFFKFLKSERNNLPVYIVEDKNTLSEEEAGSFMSQGVRGILRLNEENGAFGEMLTDIVSNLHQQASLITLARENKLVSFETAQSVSQDGRNAEIRLFDFEMGVAVDSEDAKNVLSKVSKPNVRFDDVIGADDAKKELRYFVEYLKNPKKYMGTGVKPPKGVILYGPPGTGKTMLAKAMACEADVTFIAAEGNQFLKRFVGEGSEEVHELFKIARKYAPSILFIDEIDAIGKERKGGINAAANGEETLTAFLAEMDGFVNDPSKPVFVLAATNFDVTPGTDKSLDPALMRRFDRRVYIDLPNKENRIRFLKYKISKNEALDISDAQIDNIAIRATGMSLAELDSVVELALRSAIREGSTRVTDAILEEAFETFNSGEVKKWDVSQLERVARHEAGHALVCWLSGEKPTYLTIVSRGNHGGYMQRAEQEGKAIYTKDELLSRIRTSLGGRAAEIVYYGERDGISTGASGDLASATNLAKHIICTYGMDDEFGLAVMTNAEDSAEVRASVNRILRQQMDETVKIISENKDKIDSLVEELMNKNHLNGDEIERAITGETKSKIST